ncbi:MAG: transglutaminase family protein [Flavihumibacter sp.]
MAIRVAIKHDTTYEYDRPVHLSPHIFRLRPAPHSRTPIEAYSFYVEPANHFINWQQDPFGNYQARIVFPEPATSLRIKVELIADMISINPFDFFIEEYAEKFPFTYSTLLQKELTPYLEIVDDGPLLNAWVTSVNTSRPLPVIDFLVLLNQRLNREITYNIRMEPGVQTPEETLRRLNGSCRDTAWLLVQILRHFKLAARFVSGYLVQLTPDVKSLDGPSGPAADFTDLHAWAEVYIPGAGWVGLDPTSGLFAGEGHIPLAGTPHYSSAAPVVGATDPCQVTFHFENSVSRFHEDPRVTKPLNDVQWQAIEALGYQIDADLEAGDVRLTMGGEPTFVSIDDMESAQWNTAADGKEKRQLSHHLIYRLREQFGPGGMIHYGQGKWYPGEPLPRWQYGLYWRKDGLPIWKNPDLVAREADTGATHGYRQTKKFMETLCRFLGVDSHAMTAAYEDQFFFLWTEGKTPANIDPTKANLNDSIERRTLAQQLDRGLGDPVGYVLPLAWDFWQNCWNTETWKLRRDELFLLPGNSPIGLRLPFDSLEKLTEENRPEQPAPSLFEAQPELADFQQLASSRFNFAQKKPDPSVKAIRTALCIEEREGMIYLFCPPLTYLEQYLDLIASIEATAALLNQPVRIEGYEPPRDTRVERLVVSPDPGVIEVNIHPAKSWKELLHNTGTLYEQAFLSRLGTEKFMLDGRHTGTGGGNHITIGGITPADSPLLRRPDLLQSLITYWQHHPALSYLFSGAFVGPTSQAPRIDEGRLEKLYEMEIAFSQVPPPGGHIPFWLTDRLFRHLLTDITGNTHRSEFCIDKLYSPDSSSGRLGILEFRGFDMPPHQQMSLLQMLLIRALVAAFWKKPYQHPLVRWGTELHDKFMLHHYVIEDMKEVVQYLNEAGYPFDIGWFDAYFEFRFPVCGRVRLQGMEMEIRSGIEPWHVLGEEMGSGGTARYVDSSVEKVQVKITGMTDSRYILLCNGARVPLQATGVAGAFVCGIRYRAWQPPSALHPTIGVDTPLVFDIVDTWNGKSIGGCTYHVAHPGGRNYETFPVNSYEAEGRRISRFWDQAAAPDAVIEKGPGMPQQRSTHVAGFDRQQKVMADPPPAVVNPEYPFTLDMRKTHGRQKL